jgi:hypothetical protein
VRLLLLGEQRQAVETVVSDGGQLHPASLCHLFYSVDEKSLDGERREALAACCSSCLGDALQLLCFKQHLSGAEIAIRHLRGGFAEQRVLMEWTLPVAAGGGESEVASLLSESPVTPLEKWNTRLIALFHKHGVCKVDQRGRQLPAEEWAPSDLPEFAYPDGDYYILHWKKVLQKDAFFRTKAPFGMQPDDGE